MVGVVIWGFASKCCTKQFLTRCNCELSTLPGQSNCIAAHFVLPTGKKCIHSACATGAVFIAVTVSEAWNYSVRRLLAKLLSRKPDRTGADRCGQETRTALPCAAPLRKAGPALRPGRCEHSLPGREGQKPGGGRREGKRKKKKKRGRQAADPAGRSPPARSAAMVSEHRRAEVPRRGKARCPRGGRAALAAGWQAGAEGSGGRDGGAAGAALSARGREVRRPWGAELRRWGNARSEPAALPSLLCNAEAAALPVI